MSELNRRNFLKERRCGGNGFAGRGRCLGRVQPDRFLRSRWQRRSQQHCGQRSSPDHSRRPLFPVRYLRKTVHVRI